MIKVDTVSDVDLKNSFDDYCNNIEDGGKAIVVTRTGKPEVVMVSMSDYKRMQDNSNNSVHGVATSVEERRKILEEMKAMKQREWEEDRIRKRKAYEAMEEMKRRSPFPKDYDVAAAIAESMAEKYGRFN